MGVAMEGDGVDEALAAVGRLHAERVEADACLFEMAAHFADLKSGDGLPVSRRVLPGRERAVRLGGVGTPRVAEFAAAEFGVRMAMGSWAAKRYIGEALDVRHRLPLIWARVVDRTGRVGHARVVAARTQHLSVEAAGLVDAAMADFVDGSLAWSRFEARLEGKIVAADPETAEAREAERVSVQFAKRTRVSESGTAGFYLRSTAGVIARVDATVAFVAQALRAFGDTDDVDQRRVKAMVLLANPTRAVELLAAYKALTATSLDVVEEPDELDLEPEAEPEPAETTEPDEPTEPAPDEAGPEGAGLDGAGLDGAGPLERMDAFARKVRFEPTRLPTWLTDPDDADPPAEPPEAADPADPADPADESAPGRVRWPRIAFDWSKLLPSLTMNIHVAAEDLARDAGGVARWDGVGPVTHQFVHDHLRPIHDYRIQPVIDLAQMAPADGYEIPDRHRRAVRLRTPADCFPYASALHTDPGTGDNSCEVLDVDHTLAYDSARKATDGETSEGTGTATGARDPEAGSRLENYGPLGRFHHRIKTFGNWTVRQPYPGIYLWRDPTGHLTLVDHTGTHPVTGSTGKTSTRTGVGAARGYDPPLTIPDTHFHLEMDDPRQPGDRDTG